MIGDFCSDVFWDANATWNSSVPDFSTCFQDTLLVVIPCLVFSIIGIFNLYFLSGYAAVNPLPFTWRLILKQILGVLICILSATFFEEADYENRSISTLIALFARPITYVIIIILMIKHRNHGITTSTVLSLFWICFAVTGAVMHRSVILKYDSQNIPYDWNFALCNIYYIFIYTELMMSFFVDRRNFDHLEVGSPLEEEALFSNVTYMWFNRIVYRGVKRLLTVKDFLPLAVKLKSSCTYELFSKHWKFHLQPSDLQKQNLSWALLKSFWPWLILGLILDVLYVLLLLVPPLVLDGILEFVEDDFYGWRSYFFCASLFISSFLNRTLQNNYIMYLLCVGAQVKSALISAIFRKNLLLASSKRKEFSSGAITNLVSVDIQRIAQFALYSSSLISAPFRIILVISLMWQYLGPSCLAGVAVIVILIPISFFVARMSEKYLDQQMKVKDIRLKYMNEILQGIKILKFYAWEIPFSSKVSKTRKKEIKFIRLSQMCYVISSFVYCCAPILVKVTSGGGCGGAIISENYILTAAHCIKNSSADEITVAFLTETDNVTDEYAVEKSIPHPDYDVGLLKLKKKISCNIYRNPICLPPANFHPKENTLFQFTGWGSTCENPPKTFNHNITVLDDGDPPKLLEGKARLVNDSECKKDLNCTAYCLRGVDNQAACRGDSGGSMFLLRNRAFYTMGVASYMFPGENENECDSCEPDKPFVFASIPNVIPWIIKTTNMTAIK